MSWRITRRKMLAIIVVMLLTLVAFGIWGCTITRAEEQQIKTTAGQVGGMFGLPPYVGESIAGLIIAATCHITGHRHGRKKERACHVPPKKDVPA